MRTFLISYDLANPNAKRHALADIIMSSGDRWARPLEQTWYIESDETAEEIEGRMSWLLGDEDGLLVQAIAPGSVLTNTSLRWFRRRGSKLDPHAETQTSAAAETEGHAGKVVIFPRGDDALAA